MAWPDRRGFDLCSLVQGDWTIGAFVRVVAPVPKSVDGGFARLGFPWTVSKRSTNYRYRPCYRQYLAQSAYERLIVCSDSGNLAKEISMSSKMPVLFALEPALPAEEFQVTLAAWKLSEQRPAEDLQRLETMLCRAALIVRFVIRAASPACHVRSPASPTLLSLRCSDRHCLSARWDREAADSRDATAGRNEHHAHPRRTTVETY